MNEIGEPTVKPGLGATGSGRLGPHVSTARAVLALLQLRLSPAFSRSAAPHFSV